MTTPYNLTVSDEVWTITVSDVASNMPGVSAYQVALDEGFVGTELDWLASLVGPQGDQGIQGIQGDTGAAGVGDMLAATYDPNNVAGDAFDMDNMVEGATTKILTDTERTKLAGISPGATPDQDLSALLVKANNLSDLVNLVTARINLGVEIGVDVQAYSAILSAITASFTTAQETKLGHIAVTQAVDLDQMETDIAALANGMVYKDGWDASTNVLPGAGAAQVGWFYNVSVGGTVDGIEFSVGDSIIAKVDNASTTTYAANWVKKDQTDAVQSVAGQIGTISASALKTALAIVSADLSDFQAAVSANSSVSANTAHAASTANPHNVTAAQAGAAEADHIHTTTIRTGDTAQVRAAENWKVFGLVIEDGAAIEIEDGGSIQILTA